MNISHRSLFNIQLSMDRDDKMNVTIFNIIFTNFIYTIIGFISNIKLNLNLREKNKKRFLVLNMKQDRIRTLTDLTLRHGRKGSQLKQERWGTQGGLKRYRMGLVRQWTMNMRQRRQMLPTLLRQRHWAAARENQLSRASWNSWEREKQMNTSWCMFV